MYEVFDADSPQLRERKLATQSDFESAIASYHASDRETAVRLLKRCLQANPDDTVAKMYLQRCH